MRTVILVVICLSRWSLVSGDYDCLCNYSVEKAVYPSADVNGQPLGYLYEFDCKPLTQTQNSSNKMYSVQFEKQIGYMAMDQQVQMQTCPGQPSSADLIPSTTPEQMTTPVSAITSASTMPKTSTSQATTAGSTPTAIERFTTPLPTTAPTTKTTTFIPSTSQPSTVPTTTSTTTKQTTMQTTTLPKTTTTVTTKHTTTQTTTVPKTTTTTPKHTTTQTTTQSTTTTTTTKPTSTTITIASTKSTDRPTTASATTTQQPATTKLTTPFMYWSMAANVTGTPYEYVGVGYNLLKGNPETITDPGYMTSQRIFQLTRNSTSIREAVYEKRASCKKQTNTFLLYGSKAYQDEMKGLVQPSATHNSHLMESAFTHSAQFESMRQTLDTGYNVYIDNITTCSYGSLRYATENANNENFTVTREFAKDVCALPESITATNIIEYMRFLDKWGTSIVIRVLLGTKSLDRFQTTPVQVFQHVEQTDSGLLKHSGAYQGFPSSVTINTQDYPHSKAAGSAIGTHHTTWMGSASHQVPVSSDLVPISDALDWVYWKPIVDELVAEGICSDNVYTSRMTQYLQGITTALNQYSAFKTAESGSKHHTLVDRPAIQVPVTWPTGTYGLMRAASGCPAGNTRWQVGWRKFDTEDTRAHNSFSPGIQNYMSGLFQRNDIMNQFCMKTSAHSLSSSRYDQQWPKGSYCLLKKGSCPSGFGSGYIYWDDDDINNHNAKGGSLPDGTFDKNTKIYYCCRNDGSPATNIILPTDRPFIMMRYGTTCQGVHGMSVHGIFVLWDDEDLFNKDKASGMHPLDDGGKNNHQIHFCYYQSAAGPPIVG